jgi:hypothetical protein
MLPRCSRRSSLLTDPTTANFRIDVIEVPLAAPAEAKVVSNPRIFSKCGSSACEADFAKTEQHPIARYGVRGTLNWLNTTGQQPTYPADDPRASGPGYAAGGQFPLAQSSTCHDITVYPAIGLAAGACAGDGMLIDISDPVNPVRIDNVTDNNFAYFHSATFNDAGNKVFSPTSGAAAAWPPASPVTRPTGAPTPSSTSSSRRTARRSSSGAATTRSPACSPRARTASRTTATSCPSRARRHGPGLVPGRAVRLGLHRLGQPEGDRLLRPRPGHRDRQPDGRLLVDLLEQRRDRRQRDPARVRHLRPERIGTHGEPAGRGQGRPDAENNPQHQQRITYPASFTTVRGFYDSAVQTGALSATEAADVKRFIDRAEGFSARQKTSAKATLNAKAGELLAPAQQPLADALRQLAEKL